MRNALVGSIGVFTVLTDSSKKAAAEGIEYEVIKFGEHKGAGVPGMPITDEGKAASQEMVNTFGEAFVGAVAKGRGMKIAEVMKLATGDIFSASAAKTNGLIDKVGSFDDAIKILDRAANGSRTQKLKKTIQNRK